MVGDAAGKVGAAAPQGDGLTGGRKEGNRLHRPRGKDPDILRSLPGVHRQFPRSAPTKREPRQSPRHHDRSLGGRCGEQPEDDRRRHHPAAIPAGGNRPLDDLPPHPVAGAGPDAVHQRLAPRGIEELRHVALRPPRNRDDRLDDKVVEPGQDMGEPVRAAAPPRLRRRKEQLLAEETTGDGGDVAHKPGRLHQRAAERIGQRHAATAHRLQEPRGAGQSAAVQLERIAFAIDDAAEEDVDRHEPAECLQAGTVLANGEIAPLDQRQPQVAGEVGILEPGRARRPGAEQRNPRDVPPGVERPEHRPQANEEGGQSLHV